MKRLLIMSAIAMAVSGSAQAACFADYKAKQDNPLRLHYGVAQVDGACSTAAATEQLRVRLALKGWTLLNVMSVFGDEGLGERKESAGKFYLRF